MNGWPYNMVSASRALLSMPIEQSQASLEEKLAEIAGDFTWLSEIAQEAASMFSIKRGKLEQMPKTPSLKRGAKRVRNNLNETDENEEPISAVTSNPVPTKLKFEVKSDPDPQEPEELEISRAGRPLRNCRQKSKIKQDEEPPKRSTRQSRKPQPLKQTAEAEKQDEKNKAEGLDENVSQMDTIQKSIDIDMAEPKTVAKVSGKNVFTPSVTVDQCEEKSPSVKDRAVAYENLIKQSAGKTTKSPVISSRLATPDTSKTCTPGPKIDSAKCKDNTEKVLSSKKLASSSSQNTKDCELSDYSSNNSDSGLKKGPNCSTRLSSTQVDGGRPVRTRLRLNKQKCQEADVIDSEKTSDPVTSSSSSPQPKEQEHKPHKCKTPPESKDQDKLEEDVDMFDDEKEECKQIEHNGINLDETEIMVTEIFEIQDKGKPARLKEYEMVKTKTTPVGASPAKFQAKPSQGPGVSSSCHQSFSDGHDEDGRIKNSTAPQNMNGTFTKQNVEMQSPEHEEPVRTRTRAAQKDSQTANKNKESQDSGVETGTEQIATKSNTTFTKDNNTSLELGRSTRTRTRMQKESNAIDVVDNEGPSTRTRQRKQDGSKNKDEANPKDDADSKAEVMSGVEPFKATRSRACKTDANKLAVCGSDDEVVAGSPAIGTPKSSLRVGKKRLVEDRGLSPRPKRQRSVSNVSPLSASSPIHQQGAAHMKTTGHEEERDMLLSPVRNSRAFKFNSAQRSTSGFLNRTPSFKPNTNKLYSFLNNTPSCRNSSVLTSFLKRNTPPAKQNIQVIQEQKKQKLLEKESRDKERLKKTAEMRKRRIEESRRQREDKERKVAEAREMKQRMELQQKEKINRKFEDKDKLKEKLMEERCREEKEKQRLRLRKQMEADARRKQEEEERVRKIIEQEEEARMQQEFMQRKKDFEEAERKRQIAEEKKKQEERLTDLEQKRQEEKARLKRLEEERERERERIRLEKERYVAQEKAERDRIERERREEKERKLREELEKLKALEKERLRRQEEEAHRLQQQEIQKNELKHMIEMHNTAIKKQPSATNITAADSANKPNQNSYDLTPVKVKTVVAKPVSAEDYGIDDKGSDDSTDDDEAPKKKIPEWAMGIPLKTALIKQHHNPPDLEAIFRTSCIEPPDLQALFPGKKNRRYKERTSSAIWTSPIMKQW